MKNWLILSFLSLLAIIWAILYMSTLKIETQPCYDGGNYDMCPIYP